MAAYQEIHEALTESIIGLGLSVPIAYQDSDYDPEANNDQAYIDVDQLYNEQESLDKTLFDEVTGILQLTVRTRSGGGVGQSNGLIDIILDFYKHNISMIKGGQCVVVINAGRNEGRNEAGWWVVDISVSWKSDIAR